MNMKKRLYLVEYYRKNPVTGEPGWDIHFAWVMSQNGANEAQNSVREEEPFFDAVIQIGEQSEIFALKGVPSPLLIL
jgi:hypothetical protein